MKVINNKKYNDQQLSDQLPKIPPHPKQTAMIEFLRYQEELFDEEVECEKRNTELDNDTVEENGYQIINIYPAFITFKSQN